MPRKPYNGYESWNAWNVALWLGNDESLYRLALDCVKRAKGRAAFAARLFVKECGATRTPDGARYSLRSVMLALSDIS